MTSPSVEISVSIGKLLRAKQTLDPNRTNGGLFWYMNSADYENMK